MEYIEVTIEVRQCDWEELQEMLNKITGGKEDDSLKMNQFVGLIIEWYLLDEFFYYG